VPDDSKPSPSWATEEVLEQLEKTTPPGQAVSAQVFLADTVSTEELPAVARQIVEAAERSAGKSSRPTEIGKIHRLARSFSVKAASAVIRQMSSLGRVKAVLPSEIEEGLLIRPVKKTPAP
jgi:hypothetical protein